VIYVYKWDEKVMVIFPLSMALPKIIPPYLFVDETKKCVAASTLTGKPKISSI